MSADNLAILNETGLLTPVYEPVDLGGWSEAYAGKTFQARVNPPGLADDLLAARAAGGATFEQMRKLVVVFYELSPEIVAQMDDLLVSFLAGQAVERYNAYHQRLKNFLAPN